MPYLTAPEAISTSAQTYRYIVELASNNCDWEGVPTDWKKIDVVVMEPTRDAIALVIAAAGWLKDWGIADYWQPIDCEDCPF